MVLSLALAVVGIASQAGDVPATSDNSVSDTPPYTTFKAHSSSISSLTFTPDKKTLGR
jgi:hypothetical protein